MRLMSKKGTLTVNHHTNGSSVPLAFPITHDGRTIDSVTLRRPRVGDSLAAQRNAASPAELEIQLMALLTGLPISAIELIDMQDYTALQQALKDLVTS